jgi:hypothetical protein
VNHVLYLQELVELARALPDFSKRECKVVGFCVDSGKCHCNGPTAQLPQATPAMAWGVVCGATAAFKFKCQGFNQCFCGGESLWVTGS